MKTGDVTASEHCPGMQARSLLHAHTHTHANTHAHCVEARWMLYTGSPAYGTHVTLANWAPEGDSMTHTHTHTWTHNMLNFN